MDSFQPKASNFALFLIVLSEKNKEENPYSKIDQKEYVVLGKNTLHSDMFELFSEYYALQEISHNSSSLLKDKVARRELNDRIEAIYEVINTKLKRLFKTQSGL